MKSVLGSIVFSTLLLCFTTPVHAALVVSEVMYDPLGTNTGHQWIEVQNTGIDSIDLGAKDIRLFDTSGNHVIKSVEGTSAILGSGAIAIIAQNPMQFENDFANFTGLLFKSSFSLPVAGGNIGILQTDGTVLAKAAYTVALGAKGDGNSLQRISDQGVFVAAAPTPGLRPATLPAPLAALVKPSSAKTSTNKRAGKTARTHTASSTSTSLQNKSSKYGKGTLDPSAAADPAAEGSLARILSPLVSSVWSACFLGLLAFSSFSLILIQRRTYV